MCEINYDECMFKVFHSTCQNRPDFDGTNFNQVFDVLTISVSGCVQTQMRTFFIS